MQLEDKKHLADAHAAIERVLRFVATKSLADYCNDELLRAAVERQFVTVGEALVRLRQRSPAILDRISDHQRIIRFRNIVVHGYDVLANETVWDILQQARATAARRTEGPARRVAAVAVQRFRYAPCANPAAAVAAPVGCTPPVRRRRTARRAGSSCRSHPGTTRPLRLRGQPPEFRRQRHLQHLQRAGDRRRVRVLGFRNGD